TFTSPSTGAGTSPATITATTNALGIATINAVANGIPGSYTVMATIGNLRVSFALTNTAINTTVSPSHLILVYTSGDKTPPSDRLSVRSERDIAFTVTSPVPWLSVSPASGTTPRDVAVTANPAGLDAGSYNTILTFQFSDGSTI